MNRNRINLILDIVSLVAMLSLAFTGLLIRFVLPPGSGGRGGGPALAVWGLTRHEWGDIHAWLAYTILGLVVVHVALHWRWACSSIGLSRATTRSFRRRCAIGIGFAVATVLLVLGLTWLASADVEMSPGTRVSAVETAAPAAAPAPGETASMAPESAPASDPAHLEDEHRAALGPGAGRGAGAGRGRGSAQPAHLGNRAIRGQTTLGEAARIAGINVTQARAALGLPPSVPSYERLGRVRRRLGLPMEEIRRRLQSAAD